MIHRPPPASAPLVAIVLPPRETFSPSGAGAVSLLVHRMARAPSHHPRIVVGRRCANPYTDVDFRAATPRLWFGSLNRSYAHAAARAVARASLIEVHNRAEVALRLAALCPQSRVSLFLHNDPQTMRGLATPAEREAATRRLAGIVCVSHYLAERLLPGTCAAVLPNAIDLVSVPKPPDTRDNVILFAGRLVADKGADSFVEACAQVLPQLPGWRAEMIGADRFIADQKPTRFVAQLLPAALRANVAMRGYLPHTEVLAAMARAAIVVMPSRWPEPFGLTALEAMACGAPLICSNRGGLADLVGNAALPCDPDQPASIAAAILHFATNPRERTTCAIIGQLRAQSYDTSSAATALDVYRAKLLHRGEEIR